MSAQSISIPVSKVPESTWRWRHLRALSSFPQSRHTCGESALRPAGGRGSWRVGRGSGGHGCQALGEALVDRALGTGSTAMVALWLSGPPCLGALGSTSCPSEAVPLLSDRLPATETWLPSGTHVLGPDHPQDLVPGVWRRSPRKRSGRVTTALEHVGVLTGQSGGTENVSAQAALRL